MRIAVVNWTGRMAGGAEAYIGFVAPALVRGGHEIGLWTETDQPLDRQPLNPSIAARWCADELGHAEAMRQLRHWGPDVIFTHGVLDPEVERRMQAIGPAVLMGHNYHGTCISGRKSMMFPAPRPCTRPLGPACLAIFYPRRCGGLHPVTTKREYLKQSRRRDLLATYTAVLTLSAHMQREFVRNGVSAERVHHLPPYLPETLSAAPARSEDRAADSAIRLLFTGRLDKVKGCELLIRTLPLVARESKRPVALTVAGDGPDRARCELTAAALASGHPGVTVHFTGWIDGPERSTLLAGTDVFVMPSLWPEPYGLAGLEAVQQGVPVAAFLTGGIAEWLEPGVNGYGADGERPDASGLATAILRCVALGRRAATERAVAEAVNAAHLAAVFDRLGAAAGRCSR